MTEIANPKIKVNLKDNTKAGTQSVIDNMDKIEKKSSRISNIFGKAFSDVKLAIFGGGLVGVTSKIIQATKKSSDFIEQLNVLDVAFNDTTTGIRKFTSNIAETLNLDDASIIRMASSFKILGNSMGYADEMGTKFAKLMTSITVDTASLFNMSLEDTQAMMQSAVQGQTKALRKRTGVSILDRDVQTTLDTLGIDAYVQSMNSAEKSLARVITMTYRLRDSQGDLARTIESPANRFRVLSEQISLLGRNIGNVFLPAIYAVLPYLNAILIVLNKLISSLATLLGFSENNWDFFKKKTDTLTEAFEDFGNSVGGVGAAASKTKKELSGLREFDKLNVIKTPTSAGSSGGGGGGGGGINPNLLKAFDLMFDNYNSLLDGVETKATKIANAIMRAFGNIDFTNLINSGKRLWDAFKPFAENVGKGLLWTFENVLKPLAKWTITDLLPTFLDALASAFKVLNQAIEELKPLAKFLFESFLKPLGKFAGKTVVNWLKGIGSALEFISKKPNWSAITVGAGGLLLLSTNLGKFINLIKNTKTFKIFDDLKNSFGKFKTLTTSIRTANQEFRIQQGIIDKNTGKLDKQVGVANALKTAFGGVLTATIGLAAVGTAFDDIAQNGLNLTNILGGLSGSIATISGSMQLGAAIFKNYGLAIGAVVGVVSLAITAFKSFLDANKDATAGLKEYEKAQLRLDETTRNKLKTDIAVHDNNLKLTEELGNLVDSNGKVKKSDEERVNYILHELNEAYGTQYKLVKGAITNNGKEVKSIESVQDAIKEKIRWMKLEAIQEAYKEDYNNTMKEQKDLQKQITEAEREYAETGSKTAKFVADTARAKYQENEKMLDNYQKFSAAILSKDYETALELGSNYYDASEDLVNHYKETGKQSTDDLKKYIDETYADLPEEKRLEIYANTKIAENAVDKFIKKPDKKTVKIDADVSQAANKVSSFLSKQTLDVISIIAGKKANGGILVNGKWRDIAQYDTGGLPPVGQMFVARERGPELVGNIGGHTAVMNNNQIVSSVSAGVYQAVRGAMGNINSGNGVYNIYLDKDHKLGSYTLDQLQAMAKSNGKPLTIG